MLRLKYLIPLLIFLFVCVFLFVGLYLDPRKVPSALIDKPAPEFSLPTMSGETVTKKDLLGKVYMMNVWASWCQACQYEHPYFVKLKNEGLYFGNRMVNALNEFKKQAKRLLQIDIYSLFVM